MRIKGTENMSLITDALADMPLLMKVTHVAEIIGVSPSTVYRLVEAGDLEKVEINLTSPTKTMRVTNESVRNLIERWMKSAS
jgi:predicted site-specific integrase-resolvase